MKKTILSKIFKIGLLAVIVSTTGCDINEIHYTDVTPEEFYKTKRNVYSALANPYTKVRKFIENDHWRLQEDSGDAFCVTTKGQHWYNGAMFQRLHRHQWTPDDGIIWETWKNGTETIAATLDMLDDFEKYVDYEKLGFTDNDKVNHKMQMQTIIAYCYMRCLDLFGGMPLYVSTKDKNIKRSTAQETFNHVEKLLKEAIPNLTKKEDLDNTITGELTQAAGAMMLAQLYFNSNVTTGTPMFDKCETISKEILDGKYGAYELDKKWNGPHGFDNDKSPEVIWGLPSQNAKLQYEWFYADFYHYESFKYFDIDGGANNGCHLQPSRKPDNTLYTDADFRLGKPYEKFHDKDLRKKPYRYLGNSQYEGMFLIGEQQNLVTKEYCVGSEEYKGQNLAFIDRVARYKEAKIDYRNPAGAGSLRSTIADGEENSGVRLVKVPQPNKKDQQLRWNSDHPHFRLAEVYYMYAECLMRKGDKTQAATYINDVRKRNFENNTDPDPISAAKLDDTGYRILDEWQIEFLGEGRRRTDLKRWNKYVTEKWWDHTPTNDQNRMIFPIPTLAISGDNSLTQNPGYGGAK